MKLFYTLPQLLFITLFSLIATVGWGQATIASQSFEGSGWSFTDTPTTYEAGDDIWAIKASGTNGLTATDGNNYWFMQDLDNTNGGGNFKHILEFNSQSISAFTSVTISFDYEVFEWDTGDDLYYEVFEDGVSQGEVQLVDGSNNLNASGTETINITSSATSCYIILKAEQNGGGDYGFFDNVRLEGTPSGPTVGWDNSTRTENETNSTQTISIPVTLSNFSQAVDLNVAVNEITAEAGDYTLNTTSLSFTGNGTQNVSININDDADFDDETIEITLTESTSTGITIVPDVHTLTILDDDSAPIPTAFINEFHYDNDGNDVGEFVEVAIINSFSGLLSDLTVTLYNGNGGSEYGSQSLDQFLVGSSADGFTFYTWDPSSIQNGAPDGLAISYQGTVIEFLSYEGVITATDGPANGQTSIDVGVSETSSTPIGQSLQRIGDCDGENCPAGLSWTGPISETSGDINTGEILPVEWLSFTAQKVEEQDAVQLNWSVAWEEMHDFYEVQQSTDGFHWDAIGRVQHQDQLLSAEGRSPTKYYEFLHESPETGLNLYRIRQVDLDGAEDYSIIQRVLFSGIHSDFSFAPNPARDRLYFSWPSDLQQTSVEMEITSMQGQTHTLYRGEAPGQLQLPSLAAGMYQLLVRDASGAILSRQRVVIQ